MEQETNGTNEVLKDADALKAMGEMTDEAKDEIISERREEMFSLLWEEAGFTREEVMDEVIGKEESAVERHGDSDYDDWYLRAKAQDIMLEILHEEIVEE